MASGDKPVNAVVLEATTAEQGQDLFAAQSGFPSQGKVVLFGYVPGTAPTDLYVRAEVQISARNEAQVADFDVEKQYKLTIEEV
jgi:hypothetical protein